MSDADLSQAEQAAKSKAEKHRRLTSHRFFLSYAWEVLSHAPVVSAWRSFLTYLRRFRTVAFVLRALTVLFAVLETGALVVLSTAIFLVLLPFAVALMLGILLTALLESRRSNRMMAHALEGKTVLVLFASSPISPYQRGNAQELAERGYAVIVISPFLISPRGIRESGFYCTVRTEAKNLYLVRRYYFFSLRKRVLRHVRTGYVY